jgi:LacI family transcriptional regulator
MATMEDVAQRAGVSTTTVSHVLNNTRYVSEDTTRRVMQAVEELDYYHRGQPRARRVERSYTIGVLVPDNTNPYFAEISRMLEDACFRRGYTIIICNTEQNPQKELTYLRLLIDKGVDGLVLVYTGGDPEAVETLEKQKLSCVVIDREIPGLDLDLVVSDNEAGAYAATRHLIDLGHRRIDCISGPRGIASTEDRLAGYRRALSEVQGSGAVIHGDFQVESGYEAFKSMYDSGGMPGAIFASNDLMAIGVLHGAAEQRMRVPYELSVVGFDDIQLSRYAVPPLTTVRQPKREIASSAIELLLERAQGARTGAAEHRVITPHLVVRESTGRPAPGPAA